MFFLLFDCVFGIEEIVLYCKFGEADITDLQKGESSMKRKANGSQKRRPEGNASVVCPHEKGADGNEFTRDEERMLCDARTEGMLRDFESVARETAYPMPNGVERAYLDFRERAVPGNPGASDYFRDGFEKEIVFRIDGRVAAVIDEDGYLRRFIPVPVREHHECGHMSGREDDKRHTRFGYVEGAGPLFQDMREKRRVVDFVIRTPH